MIHLAGEEPVKRALEEIALFEEEGIDGVVIENYHGEVRDVVQTLQELQKRKQKIVIGINILPNEFQTSLPLAEQYGADFVQLDHIAGNYSSETLPFGSYKLMKERHQNIIVLGGVWPKYYRLVEGSNLEEDVRKGIQRAEAIVVTGEGTGKETPLHKIEQFRKIIGEHPLIIGAGLTPENAYEQLILSNGAIVGSCFKPNNNTYNAIDRDLVQKFMKVVKDARKYQEEKV